MINYFVFVRSWNIYYLIAKEYREFEILVKLLLVFLWSGWIEWGKGLRWNTLHSFSDIRSLSSLKQISTQPDASGNFTKLFQNNVHTHNIRSLLLVGKQFHWNKLNCYKFLWNVGYVQHSFRSSQSLGLNFWIEDELLYSTYWRRYKLL